MNINKSIRISLLSLLALAMSSCGGNSNKESLAEKADGNIEEYENSEVNAIEQARPQIMVIPADQTLKSFGSLKKKTLGGREFIERNYQRYIVKDDRFRRISSFIQDAFVKQNYPLADFEQTLKLLDTQSATDIADGIQTDAKTQLLQTARPDIILELNYYKSSSLTSHDYKRKNVSYTLSAIDAYTTNVVATITESNMKTESTTEVIQNSLAQKLPELMSDIQQYYSDILKRGREVSLRITVEGGSNQDLSDESINGDVYSDWIIDYVKTHTVRGAYKMGRNTAKELTFTSARIKLLNDDGTQYGVYDWARDLQKSIRKNLGLKVSNKSQGLGEIVLSVKGI